MLPQNLWQPPRRKSVEPATNSSCHLSKPDLKEVVCRLPNKHLFLLCCKAQIVHHSYQYVSSLRLNLPFNT